VLIHINLYISLILFFIIGSASSVICRPKLARYEFSELHMYTEFRIVLYARSKKRAIEASNAAFRRISELDSIMSDYNQTSELSLLSKQAGGIPVKVSKDLLRILILSQEMAKISGGAFDITIGPAVKLWRQARRLYQLPDPQHLSNAMKLVGYKKVLINKKEKTIQLKKSGMLLDLGGIAKGFAADEAIVKLKECGIRRALVAAGGDIVASNAPPNKGGWRIGIAPLELSNKEPTDYILLKNNAVSTSGDLEQFVEIDGVRYSHVIDPRTGVGVRGQSSVSVIAPNGYMSDSLATAASVLRVEKGMPLIDSIKGVAALFITMNKEKRQSIVRSKDWRDISQNRWEF
jgi:FAD:protein FMN transferase